MNNPHNYFSSELHLCRHGNGIKLVRPDMLTQEFDLYDTGYTLSRLMQLPFNIYFHDVDSKIQIINDTGIIICGFNSKTDATNKTMRDVLSPAHAAIILHEDKVVMQGNKIAMFENDLLRHDDLFFQGISIKSPWYNNNNQLIGFFGASVFYGEHKMVDALKQISNMGLLSPHTLKNQNILTTFQENTYFSKRERDVIKLLLRGNSAKEIAEKLQLSRRTVEYYIENIKNKMNVSKKSELIEKLFEKFLKEWL